MKRTLLFSALALPLLLVAYSLTGSEATSQVAKDDAQLQPATAQPKGLQARTTKPLAETSAEQALTYTVPDGRKPFVRGAITYYPARLSEASALQASAKGRSLEVTTPDGNSQRFEFERTAESIDGTWSWVGRSAQGGNALFTFGDNKAVFGYIDVPNSDPFQVTTEEGQTWVTKADPSREAIGDNHNDSAPGPDRPAAAVGAAGPTTSPPFFPMASAASIGGLPTSSSEGASAATGTSQAAAAVEPATVDVLVAYTQLVEDRFRVEGPQKQGAAVYIAHLIELGNQSLANAKVPHRYRLVGTQLIDYSDKADHGQIVSELTDGVGVLADLRTQRDKLGADVVSVVRIHDDDIGYCGYAWIPGSGDGAITTDDEYLGFSSAGLSDDRDGGTYCRITMLAHEIGHNMGQAHVEGGTAGTHPYSYAYRDDGKNGDPGFHTVMAYHTSEAMREALYYSNPNVNDAESGRPVGTATADNARSMTETMPVVAQWRSSTVAPGAECSLPPLKR